MRRAKKKQRQSSYLSRTFIMLFVSLIPLSILVHTSCGMQIFNRNVIIIRLTLSGINEHMIERKKALICGISGQDGAYLADLLLKRGYEVYGTSRNARISSFYGFSRMKLRDKTKVESTAVNDFPSVLQACRSSYASLNVWLFLKNASENLDNHSFIRPGGIYWRNNK